MANTAEEDEHYLNDIWNVYYHSTTDPDWSIYSFTLIASFSSLKQWCIIFNSLEEYWKKGMFFIFREHIKPHWEDEHNINGGCYSMKINAAEFNDKLFETTAQMLGETLAVDQKHSTNINGLSMTPKKNANIIRIWLKDNEYSAKSLYNIEPVKYSPLMYKRHKEDPKEIKK